MPWRGVLLGWAPNPGSPSPTQIIAKEVVTIRRTVGKLAVNKATMISLSTQLSEQLGEAWVHAPVHVLHMESTQFTQGCVQHAGLNVVPLLLGSAGPRPAPTRHAPHTLARPSPLEAMASVAGTLSKSSEVMKLVNSLTKIPQMQATMREMSKGE